MACAMRELRWHHFPPFFRFLLQLCPRSRLYLVPRAEREREFIRMRGEYRYQAVIRRTGYSSQARTFETKRDAQTWVIC